MKTYLTEECPVAKREMKMSGSDLILRLKTSVGNRGHGAQISVNKIEDMPLFHSFLNARCYILGVECFEETPELLELIDSPLFEVDE